VGRTPSPAGRRTSSDLYRSISQRALTGKHMPENRNRARAIGIVIGIVVLVIALLWKRILR